MYHKQIKRTLFDGKKVRDIETKFILTVIKSSHANWLIEFYNHITSKTGSWVIINGWKRSENYKVIKDGSPALPSINPLNDRAPLVDDNVNDVVKMLNDCTNLVESFVNNRFDDDESECSEWEDENELNFERNAFAFIIDNE